MFYESITPIQEKPLGYDIAASVLRLRAEIRANGLVRPKIAETVYFEELSMVAELMNASHDIRYHLGERYGELTGIDGTPLVQILKKGFDTFALAASVHPELQFWADRQKDFLTEAHTLNEFNSTANFDDVYISASPYPEEAAAAHGEDIFSKYNLGPDPKSKKAFIYLYQKNQAGGLSQRVLILENSTKHEIRKLLLGLGVDVPADVSTDDYLKFGKTVSGADIEELGNSVISAYDDHKFTSTGEQTFMGSTENIHIDAWEFLQRNNDAYLAHYHLLELLAASSKDDEDLRREATMLTAAYWALIKERLEHERSGQAAFMQDAPIGEQFTGALNRALARGDSFSGGCVSLTLGALEQMSSENISAMIFGADPNLWIWKKGYCRTDNCPTRPKQTIVGPCDVCRDCQGIYDTGSNPTSVYAAKNKSTKSQSEDVFTAAMRFWFSNYS